MHAFVHTHLICVHQHTLGCDGCIHSLNLPLFTCGCRITAVSSALFDGREVRGTQHHECLLSGPCFQREGEGERGLGNERREGTGNLSEEGRRRGEEKGGEEGGGGGGKRGVLL